MSDLAVQVPSTLFTPFAAFASGCYNRLPASAQAMLQRVKATWDLHKEFFITLVIVGCAIKSPSLVVYTAIPSFILTVINHSLDAAEGGDETDLWKTSFISQTAKAQLTAAQFLTVASILLIRPLRGFVAGWVLGQAIALLGLQALSRKPQEVIDRLRAATAPTPPSQEGSTE